MNDIEIIRNPAMIAGEINLIKKQTREAVLAASVEIGRRLQEVKGMVGHGEWTQWLADNVQYSQSTADNLMRIASEFGDDQIDMISGRSKSQTFANLSYSQAVALFSLPESQREAFVDEHDMTQMSARDVQDEIKAIKERAAALERERDEAVSMAKKSEADAADAIAKGAKAVTELDAERNRVKEALSELNDEKKRAQDAIRENKDSKLKIKVAEVKAKEAQRKADDAEAELERVKAELAAAQAEPRQASIDAAVSEEALEEAREKARQEYAAKLATASDEHVHAFKFAFEAWQQEFRRLMLELSRVRSEEIREKLRAKALETADSMREQIDV